MSFFERFKRSPKEPDEIDLMLDPKVARDTFLLLYSKLLSARLPDAEIQNVEPFSLKFKGQGEETYQVHLENLWIQVHQHRSEGRPSIEQHLLAIESATAPLIIQPDKIVPLIKGHGYIAGMGDDAVERFAIQHLVADIWIAYNQRSGGNYHSLLRGELTCAAIEPESLHALALDNLERMMPDVGFMEDGSAFVLRGAEELTATTILTDSTWDWLVQEEIVSGEFIVAVPADHLVLFADANSAEGVRKVRTLAREYFEELDHAVSPTVFRRVGGGWKALD